MYGIKDRVLLVNDRALWYWVLLIWLFWEESGGRMGLLWLKTGLFWRQIKFFMKGSFVRWYGSFGRDMALLVDDMALWHMAVFQCCTYMYIYVQTHILVYIHLYIYVYIYIYIYVSLSIYSNVGCKLHNLCEIGGLACYSTYWVTGKI